MDDLTPESRAIYDLIRSTTTEEYEARFLAYKKETFDAVRKFISDTDKQIATVRTAVDSVRDVVAADLEAAKSSLSVDLVAVKESLSSEISALAATLNRVPRPDPGASTARSSSSHPLVTDATAASLPWHGQPHQHRGMISVNHTSSPVGGLVFAVEDCEELVHPLARNDAGEVQRFLQLPGCENPSAIQDQWLMREQKSFAPDCLLDKLKISDGVGPVGSPNRGANTWGKKMVVLSPASPLEQDFWSPAQTPTPYKKMKLENSAPTEETAPVSV